MGTWGSGPFDDDTASDFVADYFDAPQLSTFQRAFDDINHAKGYIEAPEATMAVAGAAMISIAIGRGTWQIPAISDAEEEHRISQLQSLAPIPTNLRESAVQAVKAVLANSELRELWLEEEEDEAANEWIGEMKLLLSHLQK